MSNHFTQTHVNLPISYRKIRDAFIEEFKDVTSTEEEKKEEVEPSKAEEHATEDKPSVTPDVKTTEEEQKPQQDDDDAEDKPFDMDVHNENNVQESS